MNKKPEQQCKEKEWALLGEIYNPANACLVKKRETPREANFGNVQSCEPIESGHLHISKQQAGVRLCYNTVGPQRGNVSHL